MTRKTDWTEFWYGFFEGMRIMRPIIIAAIALAIILVMAECAKATECLRSEAEVRAQHPSAWPSWSGRVNGHRGRHCWFGSARASAAQMPRHEVKSVALPPRALPPASSSCGPPPWPDDALPPADDWRGPVGEAFAVMRGR